MNEPISQYNSWLTLDEPLYLFYTHSLRSGSMYWVGTGMEWVELLKRIVLLFCDGRQNPRQKRSSIKINHEVRYLETTTATIGSDSEQIKEKRKYIKQQLKCYQNFLSCFIFKYRSVNNIVLKKRTDQKISSSKQLNLIIHRQHDPQL